MLKPKSNRNRSNRQMHSDFLLYGNKTKTRCFSVWLYYKKKKRCRLLELRYEVDEVLHKISIFNLFFAALQSCVCVRHGYTHSLLSF